MSRIRVEEAVDKKNPLHWMSPSLRHCGIPTVGGRPLDGAPFRPSAVRRSRPDGSPRETEPSGAAMTFVLFVIPLILLALAVAGYLLTAPKGVE